jgi:hypothetical protein
MGYRSLGPLVVTRVTAQVAGNDRELDSMNSKQMYEHRRSWSRGRTPAPNQQEAVPARSGRPGRAVLDNACWNPSDNSIIWYIPGHDSIRGDDSILPDRHTRKDHGSNAEPTPLLDEHAALETVPLQANRNGWILVVMIGIADEDAISNQHIRFNGYVSPRVEVNEATDVCPISDRQSRASVASLVLGIEPCRFANRHVRTHAHEMRRFQYSRPKDAGVMPPCGELRAYHDRVERAARSTYERPRPMQSMRRQ